MEKLSSLFGTDGIEILHTHFFKLLKIEHFWPMGFAAAGGIFYFLGFINYRPINYLHLPDGLLWLLPFYHIISDETNASTYFTKAKHPEFAWVCFFFALFSIGVGGFIVSVIWCVLFKKIFSDTRNLSQIIRLNHLTNKPKFIKFIEYVEILCTCIEIFMFWLSLPGSVLVGAFHDNSVGFIRDNKNLIEYPEYFGYVYYKDKNVFTQGNLHGGGAVCCSATLIIGILAQIIRYKIRLYMGKIVRDNCCPNIKTFVYKTKKDKQVKKTIEGLIKKTNSYLNGYIILVGIIIVFFLYPMSWNSYAANYQTKNYEKNNLYIEELSCAECCNMCACFLIPIFGHAFAEWLTLAGGVTLMAFQVGTGKWVTAVSAIILENSKEVAHTIDIDVIDSDKIPKINTGNDSLI